MTAVATDPPVSPPTARPAADDDGPSLFVEDQRFSIVPEWVIDADLPDAAFRLYCLLLRFGGTSGSRMPSRQTLARRLRRSTDAIDRAMRSLVSAGIVVVEHRRRDGVYLSNRYHVRTSRPTTAPKPRQGEADDGETTEGGSRTSAATPSASADVPQDAPPHDGGDSASPSGGGRTSAATPPPPGPRAQEPSGGGRTSASTGRSCAAGVAAHLRPDREVLTERTPPPPTSSAGRRSAGAAREEEAEALWRECGLDGRGGLVELATACAGMRAALGQPTTRWAPPCVAAALHLAVRGRGWPAHLAVAALRAVAADPATHSPMRVAEGGPWWDSAAAVPATVTRAEAAEVDALAGRLADLGGQRIALQSAARAELAQEGLPLTRATVVRRACEILDRTTSRAGAR